MADLVLLYVDERSLYGRDEVHNLSSSSSGRAWYKQAVKGLLGAAVHRRHPGSVTGMASAIGGASHTSVSLRTLQHRGMFELFGACSEEPAEGRQTCNKACLVHRSLPANRLMAPLIALHCSIFLKLV